MQLGLDEGHDPLDIDATAFEAQRSGVEQRDHPDVHVRATVLHRQETQILARESLVVGVVHDENVLLPAILRTEAGPGSGRVHGPCSQCRPIPGSPGWSRRSHLRRKTGPEREETPAGAGVSGADDRDRTGDLNLGKV